MGMCIAPRCDKPGRRGNSRFCSAHEHRNQRYGDPLGGPRAPYFLPPEERFWHYVDKTSSPKGCWLWTGGGRTADGYVVYEASTGRANRRSVLAHRYAWELVHGSQPSDTLHHTCYVRHCINPDHMVEMTLEENQREGLHRRRLERLAYEWMRSAMFSDPEVMEEFLLGTECGNIPMSLAGNVDNNIVK